MIKNVLSEFCVASGLNVLVLKSKLLVSNNIHHSKATEISRCSGFTLTRDLGKYLGVPLMHS